MVLVQGLSLNPEGGVVDSMFKVISELFVWVGVSFWLKSTQLNDEGLLLEFFSMSLGNWNGQLPLKPIILPLWQFPRVLT